jgi:hypothetical protein
MPTYAREEPTECRPIDRWVGGVGWLAHPDEDGQRASHAFVGDDGVWLVDPLDAPGVDDLIAEYGTVAGVAVLSDYHARDASAIAKRHGVSVHIPRWLDRAAARIRAPVERFAWSLGDSGFAVGRYAPFPGWCEAIAYRESDRTLYVPEVLGTAALFTVYSERLGVYLLCRPVPPRGLLRDLAPERILVGHGEGVFDDAAAVLSDTLANARRRLPHAVVTNGRAQLHAGIEALGNW